MRRGTRGAWSATFDWVETSIGANVTKHRRARGLTQVQLAATIGLDVKSLQSIEAGKGNATARVICALCVALGIDANDLFVPAQLAPRKRGRPCKEVA